MGVLLVTAARREAGLVTHAARGDIERRLSHAALTRSRGASRGTIESEFESAIKSRACLTDPRL